MSHYEVIVNYKTFCPTGPGGGVDPTCGRSTSSSPYLKDIPNNQRVTVTVDEKRISNKTLLKKAKEMTSDVQKQLNAIPANMRVASENSASSRVVFEDPPKSLPPTVRASFLPIGAGSAAGYLYLHSKRDMTGTEAGGNAVHEYGHAVDRFLGQKNSAEGGWISNTPEFKNAFKKDSESWNKQGKAGHRHEVSSGRELFAETFAKVAGAWRGDDVEYAPSKEEYFSRFPHTTKLIKELFEV